MKKLNTKTLMVFTLFLASFMATPMMIAGYNSENDYNLDQFPFPGGMDLIGGFEEGFGSALGGLGYGGQILGSVFMTLFLQGLFNLSQSEKLDGVYVLSASTQESHAGNKTFSGQPEYYYIPYDYYEGYSGTITGFPYVKVTRTGGYHYNITIGAGVTLLIWDQDESFINAVKRIIDFFHKFRNFESLGTFDENSPEFQALIKEGVELITWFLIHINDIFTGEELFVLNPITWQNIDITPYNTDNGDPANYSITKEYFETGADWNVDTGDDSDISGNVAMLNDWRTEAGERSDDYMTWLFNPTDDADLVRTVWTTFTFDLIQLWVKTFHIEINVAEIMNLVTGGGSEPISIASIFQGLEIEFYLFSHHLAGAFLYNDSIVDDDTITTQYVRVNDSMGDPILDPVSNNEVYIPKTSEVTHRLILNSVSQFDFKEPEVDVANEQIKWGLNLNDANITPVPIGVDLDNYLGAAQENLDYIYFGFTFNPEKIKLPTETGGTATVLKGIVKLDQYFAPWNSPDGYYSNNGIGDLDMAIIYLSTMLHFHFKVDVEGEDPTDPTTLLDPSRDFNNVSKELRIGNYLGEKFAGQLEFVDIAGPYYEYGNETTTRGQTDASTSIIPLALYETEIERHDTFEDASGTEFETFATDIGINISFNVMAYAVCYPEFKDGSGIWHDPTFSVYMVFQSTGFWALILLVAGIGLVGVATILIKRRKDTRF